jgi:hypothetical protein
MQDMGNTLEPAVLSSQQEAQWISLSDLMTGLIRIIPLSQVGQYGWALVELAPGSSRTLATRPRAVATSDRSFNL